MENSNQKTNNKEPKAREVWDKFVEETSKVEKKAEEALKNVAEDVNDLGKQLMRNKWIVGFGIILISSLAAYGCLKALALCNKNWGSFIERIEVTKDEIEENIKDFAEEAKENLHEQAEVMKEALEDAVEEAKDFEEQLVSNKGVFVVGALVGANIAFLLSFGWYKAMIG